MGVVRIETLNQNRNYHEWEAVSLSDVDTIKGLIKYRVKFDKFYDAKRFESKNPFVSNGVPEFHEIVEVTYLDLERLIKNAKLSDSQGFIVSKLMQGYSENDLAEILKNDVSNVLSVFDTACKKIKEQNDFEWYEWLETSGKIKVEGEYKQCSKCKRWLKAIEENFAPDKTGKYGLRSICRRCRE